MQPGLKMTREAAIDFIRQHPRMTVGQHVEETGCSRATVCRYRRDTGIINPVKSRAIKASGRAGRPAASRESAADIAYREHLVRRIRNQAAQGLDVRAIQMRLSQKQRQFFQTADDILAALADR